MMANKSSDHCFRYNNNENELGGGGAREQTKKAGNIQSTNQNKKQHVDRYPVRCITNESKARESTPCLPPSLEATQWIEAPPIRWLKLTSHLRRLCLFVRRERVGVRSVLDVRPKMNSNSSSKVSCESVIALLRSVTLHY